MIVGTLRIDLHLAENRSLKGKRQVVRAVKDRVHNKFNVSIAEVDDQDRWQHATLGVACVSTDGRHANEVLSHVVAFVEELHLADIINYKLELL